MPLIDEAYNSALVKARARGTMTHKASSLPGLDTGSGYIPDAQSASSINEMREEYGHFKGRFYSAAKVVIHRLASQGFNVASTDATPGVRSKALVPEMPPWAGNSSLYTPLAVHPLLSAMMHPNPYCTQFNMMEMLGGSLLVTGCAYLIAVEGSHGRAYDLYSLPSTWVKEHDDVFVVKPPSHSGKGIDIPREQVCRFRFADPQNPNGCLSPMKMVGAAVMTDEAIAGSQYAEFKNGALPKVALIAGDVMGETGGFTDDINRTSSARPIRLEPFQRNQIINWFKQQYMGVQKQGLPIVLDAIIRDIKVLSRSPAEMAFLESAEVTKSQIFEALGVPKVMAGQFENVNRASGALAEQFFVENVLNPILVMMGQEVSRVFGSLFAVNNESLLAWFTPAVAVDPELQLEMLRLGVRAYAITRNDLRRKIGFAPLDGMDDIVIPEKLEERTSDEDRLGAGRALSEDE